LQSNLPAAQAHFGLSRRRFNVGGAEAALPPLVRLPPAFLIAAGSPRSPAASCTRKDRGKPEGPDSSFHGRAGKEAATRARSLATDSTRPSFPQKGSKRN